MVCAHHSPMTMVHTTTWTLRSSAQSERRQARKTTPPVWFCVYEILGKTKFSNKNRMSGCLRLGKREDERLTAKEQE